MRLTDILQPACVKVPLEARTKEQAIYELVDLLSRQAGIAEPELLKQAIWERESTRTTGIGHGIAIPHGKSENVDALRMAVGRAPEPLEFGAIDNNPVDLIFLVTSPTDQTGPHIQALGKVSRMLIDAEVRTALRQAATADDLYQQIAQHEAEAPV